VGDELLALDQDRLRTADGAQALLQALQPGIDGQWPERTLLFCREGRIRQSQFRPDPPAVERWRLELDPGAPAFASERRRAWLSLLP
jgi:hypothetical protein